MTEVKIEGEIEESTSQPQDPQCDVDSCSPEVKGEAGQEDMSLAVLIAMVPLLVFTLMGQVGLL